MHKSAVALTLVALAGVRCWAQDTAAKKTDVTPTKAFYELTYVLRELDGDRVINTRSYSTMTSVDEAVQIRADEKVPFFSGGNSGSWQQLDVGVNIDSKQLEDLGERVALSVSADVSSLAGEQKSPSVSSFSPGTLPLIRNNKWVARVLLPLKQPTIIFSSDDPASTRKMQLQLTVTRVRQ
jgi:hypothetical protein